MKQNDNYNIHFVSYIFFEVLTMVLIKLDFNADIITNVKVFTRSGVRTHAGICPLDLKSNALTTRPSWLRDS